MKLQGLGEIEYEIQYLNRKTLSLSVSEHGVLEIKAPYTLSQKQIEDFILQKSNWIKKQLQKLEQGKQGKPLVEWKNQEVLTICGNEYRLHIEQRRDSKRDIVQLVNGNEICLTTPDISTQNIREMFCFWCKKACKPLMEQRIAYFAEKMQLSYGRITLKEQKTCWGSCSSKGNLNFNWKLLLMPPEIMDYVIVHELSHLREMNHSKRFWSVVEGVLPDYKGRRKWLKENGSIYTRM